MVAAMMDTYAETLAGREQEARDLHEHDRDDFLDLTPRDLVGFSSAKGREHALFGILPSDMLPARNPLHVLVHPATVIVDGEDFYNRVMGSAAGADADQAELHRCALVPVGEAVLIPHTLLAARRDLQRLLAPATWLR